MLCGLWGIGAGVASELHRLLAVYQSRMRAFTQAGPSGLAAELLPSLGSPRIGVHDVAELERALPMRLPTAFVEYLAGPLVETGLEWAEIALPGNASLEEVSGLLLNRDPWTVGLLQFAWGPSGDPVCFDWLTPGAPEVGAVVIDHDSCHPEDWSSPARIRERAWARWDSFGELLRFICLGGEIDARRTTRA